MLTQKKEYKKRKKRHNAKEPIYVPSKTLVIGSFFLKGQVGAGGGGEGYHCGGLLEQFRNTRSIGGIDSHSYDAFFIFFVSTAARRPSGLVGKLHIC